MNKVLSTKQVAKTLGVHLNTVWKFLASGELKGHKLGGNDKSKRHWRIWEKDLEAFINGAELAHGRHIKEDCNGSEQVADPDSSSRKTEPVLGESKLSLKSMVAVRPDAGSVPTSK